ncbi:MAG: hypothetical protein H6774_02110 [Pseudomonadales bacterium]|nr:hypothetical protein [Candidatus Woesebacteria bacterium]MCB9801861.1 hypothetical protein [Pseudomonadales bacterium]
MSQSTVLKTSIPSGLMQHLQDDADQTGVSPQDIIRSMLIDRYSTAGEFVDDDVRLDEERAVSSVDASYADAYARSRPSSSSSAQTTEDEVITRRLKGVFRAR